MAVVRCLLNENCQCQRSAQNIEYFYCNVNFNTRHHFSSFYQHTASPKCFVISINTTNTMNLIPLFVALSALLYGVWVFLEARLESFYVFEPTQLHNFAKSAIAQHGNDTRAIVTDIVANLQTTSAKPYVNLDQEWIFNNAGGAMGAMYVIHASKSQNIIP